MKPYNLICPVSERSTDERVARLNAALTVVLLAIFFITESVIPVLFLMIDFLLRSTDFSGYSLIGITSKGIVKYFSSKDYPINAGPKIFAARIGLIFSVAIILSFLSGSLSIAMVLAAVLGLFSILEATCGICVACVIYPYLYRWFYRP